MERKNQRATLLSSKKGNALIVGMIFLMLVGLIYLLVVMGTQHFLMGEVNTMVQLDDSFSDEAKGVNQELTDKNNVAWDNGFAFLVGGLLLGLFLAGATLENNPVVMGVVLLLLVVSVYAGMHIVNLYEDVADSTVDTLNFAVEFPKAHLVMSNLVVVIIAGVGLLGLGIFTSNRVGI